jgi:hypothetical protein
LGFYKFHRFDLGIVGKLATQTVQTAQITSNMILSLFISTTKIDTENVIQIMIKARNFVLGSINRSEFQLLIRGPKTLFVKSQ